MSEQVYNQLRHAVLHGEYHPGERLTSVRLARDLGVSRTPVRAALARLKTDGLVDYEDGRAAWIPPLTVSAVEEAYEIAGALEPLLIRKIARSITPEHLRLIEEAVVTMERAAEHRDDDLWVAGDQKFHRLLHELAGRELISSMLDRVGTVIDRVRFLSLNVLPEGAAISAAEHRAVFEAMSAGDPQLAQQRHEAHLDRVREKTVSFLQTSFRVGALPSPSTPHPLAHRGDHRG
ncbi:GntR family transcriptional regulator [Saccharomonospora sp. NPDC046836]|uniref:GntR family transcriptional regulator n=1 Tax=Saccharomonospora sp. NPDC046836 TaxID=3156921 RepID=UPI0033CF881E